MEFHIGILSARGDAKCPRSELFFELRNHRPPIVRALVDARHSELLNQMARWALVFVNAGGKSDAGRKNEQESEEWFHPS